MKQPIVAERTSWTEIILLCGKCAGKMEGGYGERKEQTLRAALRAELKATGRRARVRLVETKCLGVCPKKAVVALAAGAPGELLSVPRGASAAEVLARLMPERAGPR